MVALSPTSPLAGPAGVDVPEMFLGAADATSTVAGRMEMAPVRSPRSSLEILLYPEAKGRPSTLRSLLSLGLPGHSCMKARPAVRVPLFCLLPDFLEDELRTTYGLGGCVIHPREALVAHVRGEKDGSCGCGDLEFFSPRVVHGWLLSLIANHSTESHARQSEAA